MKKRIFPAVISILFLMASNGTMLYAQQPAEQPEVNTQFKLSKLTSTIDGINIPHELLEYIQYYFEGHAVTRAEKINQRGENLYRLRVDKDDIPNDYTSILLLFTQEWKFVGYAKPAPPPEPPKTPQPQQPKKPQDKPEKPEKPVKPDKPSRNSNEEDGRNVDSSDGAMTNEDSSETGSDSGTGNTNDETEESASTN